MKKPDGNDICRCRNHCDCEKKTQENDLSRHEGHASMRKEGLCVLQGMIRLCIRYRQAKKDGKYHRLLLEMLGIENYQRITKDLIDLVRRSALYTSYRKSLKIGGHICALSTLWTAVQCGA